MVLKPLSKKGSNCLGFAWPNVSVFTVHRHSSTNQKDRLSDMMWRLWPDLPGYGRRAAQFVDLLGYFTLKSASKSNKVCLFYVFLTELVFKYRYIVHFV